MYISTSQLPSPEASPMRPPSWNPSIPLSATEQKVARGLRTAKLFLFLRQIRHQLFDEELQTQLASSNNRT